MIARTAYELEIGDHTINVETTYAKILQQLVTGSLPFIFRILFFVFVRSIRDGDFKLHIICLKSMTQLMFVLDYVLCKMASCLYRRYDKTFVK